MKQKNLKYFIISFLVLVAVFILFSRLQYIDNEGFNPTDEGVILAQSWRILNNEVPHKDFISIRPVASGITHSINFLLPGSVVENARWFVVFQFFILSSVLAFLFFKILGEYRVIKRPTVFFISLLLSGFTLSILNYNLYSWTTIDAIFWTIISLPFLYSKNKWQNALGLIFVSISALSRQTFALLAMMSFLYVLILNRKNFIKYISVFIIGASPFIAYFAVLVYTNSLNDFIAQMSGRTEFLETAVFQFVKKFILSYTTPLNILCFITVAILYIKRKDGYIIKFKEKSFHVLISSIYILVALILSVKHFLNPEIDIYSLPFAFFFMTLFFTIAHFILLPQHINIRKLTVFILFVSWLSAISLGDNSPVFSTGILFISLIVMCFDIVLSIDSRFSKILFNKYTAIIVSVGIFILGTYSQANVNYRDLGYKELKPGLNLASEEFGNIKTNKYLISYYTELSDIFNSLDNARNNTIVFPHNAMFYPVMRTKNPCPLDWLIANEYIGVEERIKEDFKKLLENENLYIIIDKVNVPIICYGYKDKYYKDDIIYNLIVKNCEKLNYNSDYFMVYVVKNNI